MLKEKSKVSVVIKELTENGYGIGYVKKDKVYVRHALPKEEVQVEIEKRIQDGYVGKIQTIRKEGEGRCKSECPIYQRCGSCHLLHCSYAMQLLYKKDMVKQWLKKANLSHIHVNDMHGMEHPYHYRNKVIVGFQRNRQGQIEAGFYEEFSHRIIPYQSCLLHDERCDAIIQTIVSLMKKLRMEPYLEDRRKGFLRHVLLRKSSVNEQIMVVFVCASEAMPMKKQLVKELLVKHPYIATIIQNINKRKTSIVLGDEERILYGKGYIEDILCQDQFRISSRSFYQINHEQCEKLYEKAIALCQLKKQETLLDAYCGIGTIGMYASRFVKQVIGVEKNRQAVKDAIENAKRNKVKNIRFFAEDASIFMEQMAKRHESVDVVVMDPPRTGSTKQFIQACASIRAKKIVYISCDPRTQIRDLKDFEQYGYTTSEMELFDMFPHTMGIESIVLLQRR